MIKKITFFFCTFLLVAQTFGQAEYYITSEVSKSFTGDNLNNIDSTIYSYDDQERLILEESVGRRNEYSYEENFVTKDIYYSNELYSQHVTELNEDGFIIVELRYRYSSNGVIVSGLDSTFRNPANQVIRHVEYKDTEKGFEKTYETFNLYANNGRIITGIIISFANGEIETTTEESYDYDSEGNLERLIYKTDETIEDYPYSDTTFYFYEDDVLESTLKRDHGIEGFYYCILEEFEIVGDYRSNLRSIAYELDCSDYTPEGKSEQTLNDDIYLGFESRSYDYYDVTDEMFVPSYSVHYAQEGTLGDNQISVNSLFSIYEDGEEFSRSEGKYNYMKYGIVANSNTSLEKELILFPNTTSRNSKINYKIEGVDFDNVKIIDFAGQVVAHAPVVDKTNLYINAPNTSGMYFVQLYRGKKVVSKAAKLIVK